MQILKEVIELKIVNSKVNIKVRIIWLVISIGGIVTWTFRYRQDYDDRTCLVGILRHTYSNSDTLILSSSNNIYYKW